MGFRKCAAVLFTITFVYQSCQVSYALDPLPVFQDGYTMTIELSSASFDGGTSVQGIINPGAGITVVVDPTAVQNASFMIFQVHSYIKPLILSSIADLVDGSHLNGTDIGFYTKLNLKPVTYYIFNHHFEPVSLLLVPMLYGSNEPIPGGCNLSFPVKIAPFMTLTYQTDNEIVQIDAQAASIQAEPNCKPLGLSYEVYELPLTDTSADAYFDGIISMISAKGAELRGSLTRKPIHQPILRRRFASYPGYGSIYVVTVRNTQTGISSAYIPIAKYGCVEGNEDNCYAYVGSVWVLSICAVIFIMAEIRYILGGSMKLLVRTAFILGTIITFEPALPSSLRWTFLGFFILAFGVVCIAGQLGQALSVFTDHAFALVPAHVFFGMSLYSGLGMVSGFQDWLVVIYLFGIYFLAFYILIRMFPEHTLDQAFGIFIHLALISAITNGMIFYAYIDPSRILRQEFSDVIFSPPVSLTDHLLILSWPFLMVACNVGRQTVRQRIAPREYQEINVPPPYTPHTSYMTI